MEQPRRRLIRALGGLALLAVAVGFAWNLLQPDPERAGPPEVRLPEPVGITVEVLNGTGRRGLARTATRLLREQGFDVVFFGTAGDSAPTTLVLARRGDSLAAERVARALGTGRVRVAWDTLLRLDVTVLLGDDYRPPPGVRP